MTPDDLPPPPIPDWPAELPRLEGPAESVPFVLAGERASVIGDERSGPEAVDLHPFPAIRAMQAGLPPAERVRVSAGSVLRRLVDGSLESVLVLPRLPGVVLQWALPEDHGPLRLAWEVPGATGIVRDPEGDLRLRLPLPDDDRELVFRVPGRTGRWRLEPESPDGATPLRVGLTARSAAGTLSLTVSLEEPERVSATAVRRRLAAPATALRSWAGEAGPEEDRGLVLEASDPQPGRRLLWARRRLERSVTGTGTRKGLVVAAGYGPDCRTGESGGPGGAGGARPTPTPATLLDSVWVGHGLLAAGRHEAAVEVARRLAARIGSAPAEPGTVRPDAAREGVGTLEAALVLHLVGRCTLWSGSTVPLREGDAIVTAWVERLRPVAHDRHSGASSAVAARAALATLAEACESAPGLAAATAARQGVDAAGRISLPVIGPAGATSPGPTEPLSSVPRTRRLAAILAVGEGSSEDGMVEVPATPPGESVDFLSLAFRAWARWGAGDPADAHADWLALLSPDESIHGRGLWGRGEPDALRGCPWHSATTALVLAPLVFGFLGARADAPFGRLRLAPRVTASWPDFRIGGLRVGDVRIGLGYRRSEGRHTFVLEPHAGRVPPNLVFEPLVPLREIGRVRVDGADADLETYRSAGLAGVRLQLPLDSRREVTLEGDPHQS